MNNFNTINKMVLLSFSILLIFGCTKNANDIQTAQIGKSGSLARMIVVDNYLYAIDNKTLSTFDITDAKNPININKTELDFGIETLFPFANYIFVGSNDGMYIYDITNPANPVPASSEKIQHVTACDPVVANSNYAYVTLNSLRQACGNFQQVNELQIIDIQNVLNPNVVNIVQMSGPKGLGLDGNTLFVCDKNYGVIIFDLTLDPVNPLPIDTLSGFTANDVIPDNGNLMVVADDGLRQFDYNDLNNISLTSLLDLND